jgi:hypothetical protein
MGGTHRADFVTPSDGVITRVIVGKGDVELSVSSKLCRALIFPKYLFEGEVKVSV